jgi:hypothetical protein
LAGAQQWYGLTLGIVMKQNGPPAGALPTFQDPAPEGRVDQ